MKKILPIKDPIINAYPDYANHLSIVQTEPYLEEWMYCNFIQLYFNPKEEENIVRYYYVDVNGWNWHTRSPILEHQILHKNLLQTFHIGIIDFVKKCIDLNYYCDFYVDEYYLPDFNAYHVEHFPHTIFVYGYDTREKILYTSGFNKSLHYSHNEISFHTFEKAYNKCKLSEYYEDRNMINLYFIDRNKGPFRFSIDAILAQLKDYLYSNDSQQRFLMNFNPVPEFSFGLDCINKFVDYLDKVIENPSIKFSPKSNTIFWEHKKFMVERISYMQDRNCLPKDCKSKELFEELTHKYRGMQSLAIKYTFSHNPDILKSLKEGLLDIYPFEKNCFETLISEIESYISQTPQQDSQNSI